MKILNNTNIPFALLTPIMDFVEKRFALANPPITLNRNTALSLFAGPMSGAPTQLLAVLVDDDNGIKGLAAAYVYRSPVDGNRVCHSPMFLCEPLDGVPPLAAEVERYAKASGANLLRIESHLSTPVPGIQAQTMTYVKGL